MALLQQTRSRLGVFKRSALGVRRSLTVKDLAGEADGVGNAYYQYYLATLGVSSLYMGGSPNFADYEIYFENSDGNLTAVDGALTVATLDGVHGKIQAGVGIIGDLYADSFLIRVNNISSTPGNDFTITLTANQDITINGVLYTSGTVYTQHVTAAGVTDNFFDLEAA